MTRVATMGTSSCATIAIQDFKFKPKDVANPRDWNEVYRESKSFTLEGKSVQNFYDNILYPTDQELGRSGQYPFDALMDAIDNSSMETKFIIATLNKAQYNLNDKYWDTRLKARGFVMFDATKNSIGQECYLYNRSNNRIDLPK